MLSLSDLSPFLEGDPDPGLATMRRDDDATAALSAPGKRRQNLNLYGFDELPLKILLVSRASVDQH